MRLGMVGLGRMGANITRRLIEHGHDVVAFDLDAEAVAATVAHGATGAAELTGLVEALEPPRAVWVMVPAAVTGAVIDDLALLLGPGDIVIDGGNSYFRDDLERAATLARSGIHFVDVGTSGGVYGLERGYCLMIGGDADPVERLDPIFSALAPGVAAAPRTGAAGAEVAPAEQGYLHCGPAGAGHFVKMVHNGIEYGLMAAYAEGFNILRQATLDRDRSTAADPPPSDHRDGGDFDFDVAAIAELWRRGSVVSSWLLDLTATALAESPDLSEFAGHVSDSGEGRWTVLSAVEQGVPAPVLSAALYARFDSRGNSRFANQLLSAMRNQFGGHREPGTGV